MRTQFTVEEMISNLASDWPAFMGVQQENEYFSRAWLVNFGSVLYHFLFVTASFLTRNDNLLETLPSMASRKLAKIMTWIKDQPSEVRRNNSKRYLADKPLKRRDINTTCASQSLGKANGAAIVKTSDFLPSNKHEKLLVMNNQSRMSLYIPDRFDGQPFHYGGSFDRGSLPSIPNTTNEKLSSDVQSESYHGLDDFKDKKPDEETTVPITEIAEENKVLKQQLAEQKKIMTDVQQQYQDMKQLVHHKELEVLKLDALVVSLRRLIADNQSENTDDHCEDAKSGSIGDDFNTSSHQLQILVDELASEQWKNIKLAEKHDSLEAQHQKIILQQIEHEEIIKELQRDIASYQDTVYRCEIEKDRMQTQLNNYVWKAQFATKYM